MSKAEAAQAAPCVLSIQSWVAYGHVGNAAAAFPLQRLGAEVWAIHTVQFSNHTGYGDWRGQVFDGAAVSALVDGMAARGALGRCDAVLSGYMGDAGIGGAILDAVARVRAANPAAIYCCDPVIGDADTGPYVRDGIEALLGGAALPAADLATPNLFELERLAGHACTTRAALGAAVAAVRARMRADGPRVVLVTSVRTEETPADSLDLIAAGPAGTALIRTPLLDLRASGAGDVTAALFLYHWLATRDAGEAASRAAAGVHGLLRRTRAAGSAELLVVQAQEEFVTPSIRFPAERL